jgi:A/G-specific adenine glycosylase
MTLNKFVPSLMDFSSDIIIWYKQKRRDLPWRSTNDPYKIWLSEVILQQTRVEQGMPYYFSFVEKYPDVHALAEAPEQDVLKLWQGLGFYSRARNLHFAAKQVVNDNDGVFPRTFDEIKKLKGVGDYTAAAIASIAFGEAEAVVDGNVKRVIARLMGVQATDTRLYKDVKALMDEHIDKDHPGEFNQAVMEFGALQCTPKSPDCNNCIFSEICFAFRNDMVDHLPARKEKKKPRDRYFSYFVIKNDDAVVLQKRTGDDIWKNLYEFPLIESNSALSPENLLKEPDFISWFGSGAQLSGAEKEYKHQLSHQTIHARYYTIKGIDTNSFPEGWKAVSLDDLEDYPISRLMERFLEED